MTTVRDAAKILKVSVSRVHQFIDDGRLRGQLVNPRLYLVNTEDVRKLATVPRVSGAAGHRRKKTRRAS